MLLLCFTVLLCPGNPRRLLIIESPGRALTRLPLSLPQHTQSREERLKLDNSMSSSSCLRMDKWMEGCWSDAKSWCLLKTTTVPYIAYIPLRYMRDLVFCIISLLLKQDSNNSVKLSWAILNDTQTRKVCFIVYLCRIVAAFQGKVSG